MARSRGPLPFELYEVKYLAVLPGSDKPVLEPAFNGMLDACRASW